MAILNPDLKDINPVNPIGWSKSAEVPSHFASASSEAIKGAGELIKASATAGDELVKESAQRAVEEKIIPERDEEIKRLAAADFTLNLNQAAGSVAPTAREANTTVSDISLINPDPTSGPQNVAELKALPNTLSLLDSAKANGKLSPTAYYGRLMSIASDLRSRYPVGYREYIDQQISKITGVDPANAYIHSIMGDINSFVTNQQAERGKVLTEIMKYVGSNPKEGTDMYTGVANGSIPMHVGLGWAAEKAAIDYKHTRNTAEFQEEKMGEEQRKARANTSFNSWLADNAESSINGTFKSKGMDAKTLDQLITMGQRGELKNIGSPQYEAWVQEAMAMKNNFVTKARAELNKTDKTRPYSYARSLGGEGEKAIQEAAAPFNDMIKALQDKELGLAGYTGRVVEALKRDGAHIYWQDPSYRKWAIEVGAYKAAAGDNAMTQLLTRQNGLQNLPNVNKVYTERLIMNLSSPPVRGGYNVNGVTDALTRTQQTEEKQGYKTPETYQEIQNLVAGKTGPSLLNPATSLETKKAIAMNFFSPEQNGFLRKIQPSRYEMDGKFVPGREAWYARFTQPDVVNEIERLGDPQVKQNYHEWVKTNYEAIFADNIKLLGKTYGNRTTQSGEPVQTLNFPIQFNDKTNTVHVLPDKRGTTYAYVEAKRSVERLNQGIQGLANSYKVLGKSNEEIQEKIIESLNFSAQSFQGTTGLPERILESMKQKYLQQQAEELAKKKAKRGGASENDKYKP